MEENKDYLKKNYDVKASIEEDDDDNRFKGGQKKPDGKSKTPVLDTFGRDLTKMAEDGKIDPIIGRDKEIERVSQILSRRKKNNPLLIGEPGTGKTSIGEGLALKISERRVSRTLFNKRIYSLDLASMVAGTKYRGQFEERIKALMSEVEKDPDIILFIDEVHTIIGAGGASGSMDASNMFKPALSRGDIQIIGATTMEEYRKHIEKDGALDRRFQKVIIQPTSEEETIQILDSIKDKYEKHHNVIYTEDAIKACVHLTSRYITDRHLPDKAIDALDEAGSRVHISKIVVPKEILDIEEHINKVKEDKKQVVKGQRYEEAAKLRDVEKQLLLQLEEARLRWEEHELKNRQIVNEDSIAEVVSMMSGVPVQKVSQSENKKLANLNAEIMGKVIGQDDAVRKVIKSIQRGRVGLKDPNKPLGVFLFAGDTGTGKTHLAKTLAKHMFDSEDNLVRIDMSEFMEKISISRIVGASAGYIGYDDSTILDQIRRKPYSVILLDEIEKAHEDVFNLFLQAFDEGHMTDTHGRKVDLKNCIFIMTSNVGVKNLKDFGTGVGFKTSRAQESQKEDQDRVIQDAIKKKFKPEFINRIDSVVIFNPLTEEDIKKIIDIELVKVYDRVLAINYTLQLNEGMKEHLFRIGWDPNFGARPLKRAIQRWIEDELTEFIIENSPELGSTLIVDYNQEDDKALVSFKKPKRSKKTE